MVVSAAGTHLPADAAGCTAARASVLAGRLEPGDVVAGAAALWLHGVASACGVVDVSSRAAQGAPARPRLAAHPHGGLPRAQRTASAASR